MEAAVKTVLAWVNNLMFSVRIGEVANALGGHVVLVSTNEELIEKLDIHPSLIILDLNAVTGGWQQTVAKAKESGVPVLAYGPHVNVEARKAAEAAGCDEVVANSKLTLELPNLLAKYLTNATAS
jgi:CheY-like chemotaxis protein